MTDPRQTLKGYAKSENDLGRAIRAVLEENERLTEELKDDRRFCLCGCPTGDHETYGDEGESCENEKHHCVRVCAAATSAYVEVTARAEALEARIEAALAHLGAAVSPGDYGSFLVLRGQVVKAVKALRGESNG